MGRLGCKTFTTLAVAVFLLSFAANLSVPAFGAEEFTVTFLEFGKNGVITRENAYIKLAVTNSLGQYVSGVQIDVINPPYCPESYWGWTVSERTSDYLITANNFPFFALREDFDFTLSKAGFNSKTVTRELAINAPFIDFIDEYGSYQEHSDLQFNMDSFPSHFMIYSQFQTIFIESVKYFVTQAKLWTGEERPFGYIILDANYDLVVDEGIRYNATLTYLVGRYFSMMWSPEDIAQLRDIADDLSELVAASSIYYFLTVARDVLATLLGNAMRQLLPIMQGKISDVASLISAINENDDDIVDKWIEFLEISEYLEIFVSYFELFSSAFAESELFGKAILRLRYAGDSYRYISDQIEGYIGTTRFEFLQVDWLYDLLVRANAEFVLGADIINELVCPGDIFSQTFDVAKQALSTFVGLPSDLFLTEDKIFKIWTNSLCKFAECEQEYYRPIKEQLEYSNFVTTKMQETGHLNVVESLPNPDPDDFRITAHHGDYATATIPPGGSTTFTVSVETVAGSPMDVALSCSGHDATMSVSFAPSSADPPFTSTLTVVTTPATYGSHVLTITGTSGIISRSCQVNLIVTTENLQDFELVELETPVVFGSWAVFYGYFPDNWVHSNTDIDILCNFGVDDTWWKWYDTTLWENPNTAERDQFTTGLQPIGSLHAGPILKPMYDFEYPVTYYVKAGNHGTSGQQSNLFMFQVIKAPTSSVLSVSNSKILEDDTVTFNGRIQSSYGVDPSDYWDLTGTWVIEMRQQGGDWSEVFSGAISAEYRVVGGPSWWGIDGSIEEQVWTPPSPGLFEFRLSYSGEYNYEPSTSEILVVNVMPNSYPITVTINGLPPSSTTQVTIDELLVGTQNGGSTETYYNQSIYESHVLSVDPIIEVESDTHYVASPMCVSFSKTGEYNFTYQREFALVVETYPETAGTISLTGSHWFPEGVTVEATANPEEGYDFDHWVLDDENAGSDELLSFTMDSPRSLEAIFTSRTLPSLVVRGSNNRIYYRMYNSSEDSWDGWNVVPSGATSDSPATAVCCGRLHVVVRGFSKTNIHGNRSLWHGWINLTDGSFSGWSRISGATPSTPTLACYDSQLILVVRGLNNRIYYRSYNCTSDEWGGWTALPSGTTCDSPAAAILDDTLHIVVRGFSATNAKLNNTLYHGWMNLTDSSFSNWARLSGATPSAPTLTSNGTVLCLVVRGTNNRVYYRYYGDVWSGWDALPGATSDSPAAAMLGSDLHIVVLGVNGKTLWHGNVDPTNAESFSGWTRLSGSTPSAPTLTS